VLSNTTVQALVRTHGQLIRLAEQAEVAALLERTDLADLTLFVVPTQQPRRSAPWPAELTAALIAGSTRPPRGVTVADWEQVLTMRQEEHTQAVADLQRLGPQIAPDEMLTSTDEVLTRKLARRRFNELRTAQVVTTQGHTT